MIADKVKSWKVEFVSKDNGEIIGNVKIEALTFEEAYEKAEAYELAIAPDNWTFDYIHLDTVIDIGHGLEGLY